MTKIGRNDPCPCGSGKKYKHCCQPREQGSASQLRESAIPGAMEAAIVHHRAGHLPLAEAIYRQVLKVSLQHADAHFNLGLALQAQGGLDAAIASYGKALAIRPDYAEVHSALGNALRARGNPGGAAESYRSSLAIRPGVAEVRSNLGNVLAELGLLDEAIACYRQALALRPDVAEVHSNLGLALKDQGRLDEAVESLEKALQIKPDYAGAHFNLGLALQVQGRHEAAAESYRRTVAIRPDYAQAHNNLAAALEAQGKLGEAVESYRTALGLDPSLLAAYNGLNSALSTLVPLWHVPMMNDTGRNEAYYSALRAAVTPGSNVFEIGTGSGLLSMMAARAGANTVTTCEAEPLIAEAARRVIADNALDGRIRVIAKKSNDLEIGADMAQKADILVSEIFSSELVGERVLASIEDARRRLLTRDCRVIPAAGSIMIALFGGEAIGRNMVVEDVCGFDLRRFNTIVARRQFVGRNDVDIELLTDDVEAFRFDFENRA